MKRTDIAMIILIASVSMLVAYLVASAVFGGLSGGSAKVKTVDPIDSTIVAPSTEIFNSSAINPSVEVQINSAEQKSGTH